MSFKDKIDRNSLPRHIAVIMDGNGRWAKQRGRLRVFGHENGVKAVREITEASAEIGIEYLTLYAFSTENWKRPKYEVDALMKLLVKTINQETPTLMKNDIRLLTIGDTESLDKSTGKELEQAVTKTAGNNRMSLILALSYSSRWEIVKAVKEIARNVKNDLITVDDINQDVFCNYLTTKQIPDPELLIRTSGEYRISNFLLWQIAYAELYFSPKLWPDFRKEDLYEAIFSFQNRERRFGMISEQLNGNS